MESARIILVRHGPVAIYASGFLSFEGFCRFIADYEAAGIGADAAPPAPLIAALAGVENVFASDAPRVLETLARLNLSADALDADFREAPPLSPKLPLRLPSDAWLVLARARGEFSPELAEARRDLRARAERCAERLLAATSPGQVALVGHGWFNRYVAAAVKARGWTKASGPGFGRPWGFASYVPPN